MVRCNDVEQLLTLIGCFAAIIERIENDRSASVIDSVPSAESLRPVKRKDVRSALTLAIDIDTADLIDERVDQGCNRVGVGAEDANLLAVVGADDILQGGFDGVEL